MHLLIWKKMKNARALLLFQEWSLYYYRSLFKEAFSSLDIRREDCMRQVSLSHATGRRHAWVTYLRTVFRSRQECERVRASAMQAPPWMNSRRRLERDSCVVYVRRVCTSACACVCDCKRVARQMNIHADGGLLTPNATIIPCYFVIAQITFYWRNLYPIIPRVFFPFLFERQDIKGEVSEIL